MSASIASGRLGRGKRFDAMGDTLCCQCRSFDLAAPLATSEADRSEHRMQYRPSQPDAARLDFATVAAYEEILPVGGGRPVPSKIRQAPSGLRRPDRRNGREGEGRLFRDAGIPRTPVVYSAGG